MGATAKKPRLTPQVLDGLRTAVSAWLAGEPEENEDGDTDVPKVEAVEAAQRWLDVMQEGE